MEARPAWTAAPFSCRRSLILKLGKRHAHAEEERRQESRGSAGGGGTGAGERQAGGACGPAHAPLLPCSASCTPPPCTFRPPRVGLLRVSSCACRNRRRRRRRPPRSRRRNRRPRRRPRRLPRRRPPSPRRPQVGRGARSRLAVWRRGGDPCLLWAEPPAAEDGEPAAAAVPPSPSAAVPPSPSATRSHDNSKPPEPGVCQVCRGKAKVRSAGIHLSPGLAEKEDHWTDTTYTIYTHDSAHAHACTHTSARTH